MMISEMKTQAAIRIPQSSMRENGSCAQNSRAIDGKMDIRFYNLKTSSHAVDDYTSSDAKSRRGPSGNCSTDPQEEDRPRKHRPLVYMTRLVTQNI